MSVPFMIRDEAGDYTIERRYHGRVLREWENNGYHDSDWYVLVQEDDGTFRSFCYSTTRGGSAPANADVDATDEVKAAYKAHQERIERVQRIGKYRRIIQEAAKIGLTSRQWLELRQVLSPRHPLEWFRDPTPSRYSTGNEHWFAWAHPHVFYAYEALRKLKAGSFRSDFKRKLAQQVFDWVNTPEDARQYDSPLSPKQLQYLG